MVLWTVGAEAGVSPGDEGSERDDSLQTSTGGSFLFFASYLRVFVYLTLEFLYKDTVDSD